MSGISERFKIGRAIRHILGASAAWCVLATAGCGHVAQSVTPKLVSPRVDWGMSLLNGGAFAAGQYPAKFSFDITATPDCTNDFVVYNTGLLGSAGTAANIVAFNNLYSTQGSAGGLCDQDGPSVYWSYYFGGGGGRTRTSVALSLDGSKVALVEDGGFGTAVLNI
jgi:hypothetical protein